MASKSKKKERVEIKCPVRVGRAVKNTELPFKMLVMAPLSAQRAPALKKPQLVSASGRNSVNALMKKVRPTLVLDVRNVFSAEDAPEGTTPVLTLELESLNDFTPEGLERVLSRVMPDFAKELADLRRKKSLRAQLTTNSNLTPVKDISDPGLLLALSQPE